MAELFTIPMIIFLIGIMIGVILTRLYIDCIQEIELIDDGSYEIVIYVEPEQPPIEAITDTIIDAITHGELSASDLIYLHSFIEDYFCKEIAPES